MTDPWGRMTDPSRGKSVKEGRAPINRYTSLNTIWVAAVTLTTLQGFQVVFPNDLIKNEPLCHETIFTMAGNEKETIIAPAARSLSLFLRPPKMVMLLRR